MVSQRRSIEGDECKSPLFFNPTQTAGESNPDEGMLADVDDDDDASQVSKRIPTFNI